LRLLMGVLDLDLEYDEDDERLFLIGDLDLEYERFLLGGDLDLFLGGDLETMIGDLLLGDLLRIGDLLLKLLFLPLLMGGIGLLLCIGRFL
jgi:hypothetical protein